jgi:hypothetical protein
MFRISKPHAPYAFDVAAERILEGWKYAGQPIIKNQTNENEHENLARYPTSSFIMVGNKSSIEELLQTARSLARI